MADIKFSCPHCEQHIQAETGYAGMQINCPACKGSMIVPGDPVAPSTSPPPPPPPSAAGTQRSHAAGCPSCGAALPRGAVLCTSCGYNLVTRKRQVAGKRATAGKRKADARETPWYKTAYPYVGAVVVIMAILYFLGRNDPGMRLAFAGFGALYVLTVHIVVVVAAFQEGVGTGFLTLCVPFFALYFVFKICESDTLKILYGVAILLNIAVSFLKFE